MSPTERLQKVLAAAGIASRRASEEIIAEGRVQVNGKVVLEQGIKVDPAVDEIKVDGAALPRTERHIYIALNKPVGVLSTASDERGRTTVLDLVPVHERVYPVGRLDADTEGLLLLSNDGEMTERLTHPRYGHEREYRALVHGAPADSALKKLRRGIQLEDGPTGRAEIEFMPEAVLRREKLPMAEEGAAWLKVVIREGRKRQIRYMFESIGHPVLRLIRISIGPLTLGDLPEGQYRFLSQSEVQKLRDATAEPERARSAPRSIRGRMPSAGPRARAGAERSPRGRTARGDEDRRPASAPSADRSGSSAPSGRPKRLAGDETGESGRRPRRTSRDETPADEGRREGRRKDRAASDLSTRPDRRTASRKALDRADRVEGAPAPKERRHDPAPADRDTRPGRAPRRGGTIADRRKANRKAADRAEPGGEKPAGAHPASGREDRRGDRPARPGGAAGGHRGGSTATRPARKPTREGRK